MKPALFCLVATLAVTTLIVAILLQKPKKKEGFVDFIQQMPVAIGLGVLVLIVFAVSFLFFYSQAKY